MQTTVPNTRKPGRVFTTAVVKLILPAPQEMILGGLKPLADYSTQDCQSRSLSTEDLSVEPMTVQELLDCARSLGQPPHPNEGGFQPDFQPFTTIPLRLIPKNIGKCNIPNRYLSSKLFQDPLSQMAGELVLAFAPASIQRHAVAGINGRILSQQQLSDQLRKL